jgi:hypothetical protein
MEEKYISINSYNTMNDICENRGMYTILVHAKEVIIDVKEMESKQRKSNFHAHRKFLYNTSLGS